MIKKRGELITFLISILLIFLFLYNTQLAFGEENSPNKVNVRVKYIYEDGTIYKEEVINVYKGQILKQKDLPNLEYDMQFIDNFLFYDVKGDGTDELIRKVKKLNVRYKQPEPIKEEKKVEPEIKEPTYNQPIKQNLTSIPTSKPKEKPTVIENKSNSNNEYPINHEEKPNTPKADARQFVTFTTKDGKKFYLIINHDKENDNVLLLKEVSEEDIINSTEPKEVKKQEPPTTETPKKIEEPRNSSSNLLIWIILTVVLIAVPIGAMLKKKKRNMKENKKEDSYDNYFEGDE